MVVVSFYAGNLGLMLAVLSLRVIAFRHSAQVSLGHGANAVLERRIRAQANFAEYAPLALILIGALELSGVAPVVLHLLGLGLVMGRALHAWALSFTDGSSIGRTGGMALTLAVIIIAAGFNLTAALSALSG